MLCEVGVDDFVERGLDYFHVVVVDQMLVGK